MRQIAERAGVNKSTVSRVLSGRHPGSASADTAALIQRVATDLGYRIDPWAASLRTQRTRTIGVLIPRLTDVVLAMIFEALDASASAHGYEVLVASTGDDALEQRRRIDLLEGRRVDGMVVMTGHLSDRQYFDDLAARGVKFVLCNRAVGDHPVIRADDRDGGRQVANHLLDLGHRRIGVVAGPSYAPTAVERVAGFQDALTQRGVPLRPELVVESEVQITGGETATKQLMSLSPTPTAIFAINDFAAIGAVGALSEAGYTPGSDVAIAGYNDIPLCSRLPIPLTSVAHPVADIGRLAVAAVLQQLSGTVPESVVLPVHLNVRASTAL